MNRTAYCRLDAITIDIPVRAGKRARPPAHRGATRTHEASASAARATRIRALDDVTLKFEPGDRVAITGSNGAGKTTLLRVMAGSYPPTRGRIARLGRVSTLQPLTLRADHITGYDSILTIGSLLGLGRHEVKRHFDQVATYSELNERLALPVSSYSTGMLARLTFATLACLEPDILLVDEWLNALDRAFLPKVQGWVEGFAERGGILVFASHQPDLIERLCTTAVVLDAGRVQRVGSIAEALCADGRRTIAPAAVADDHPSTAVTAAGQLHQPFRLPVQPPSDQQPPP